MASGSFYGAPASSGISGATFLASLLASWTAKNYHLGLDATVLPKFRMHRLLTSQFVFSSAGELVFGLILLYNFRQFERQMGSTRFLAYTMLSCVASMSAQLVLLVLVPTFLPASGPYTVIFSLFVQFFATIPKLQRVKFFGAEFSEKSLYYLLGAQLLFARGMSSAIVGVCGLISGLLCMSDVLPYRRVVFPKALTDFATNYILPILASPNPAAVRAERARLQQRMNQMGFLGGGDGNQNQGGNRVDRLIPGGAGFGFGAHQHAALAAARALHQQNQQGERPAVVPQPADPPSEESIENLVAMGFTRDQVIDALGRTRNDQNRAVELLLSGS